MDIIDGERIILEVEQNPCVYDPKNQHYNNRELKESAWMTIAKNVVGEGWEEIDEGRKYVIGKEVKRRWKNMKDSYLKYIKSVEGKKGESKKIKRPCLFHRKLKFLEAVPGQRQTSGNMTDEPQNLSVDTMKVNRESTCQKEPATWTENTTMPKIRKTDSSEQDIINIPKSNVQPARSLDPDEMFLLSQLPTIKQMSPSEKMDFQVKFMQLLLTYNKPSTS